MNIKKLNGSFDIIVNGMPYNTIEGDKYYQQTLDLYNSNPELFELEKKTKKSLEELKQEKLQELKEKREEYKKTIFIKGVSLFNLDVGTNNYQNLIRSKFGWTKEDLEKYDEELEKIVEKYDNYKNIVKNEKSIKILEDLIIDFKKDFEK